MIYPLSEKRDDMNYKAKPFYLSDEQTERIQKTVASMTEREKVGQLFCLMGNSYSREELIELAKEGIGGVLFRPMFTAEETVRRFEELEAVSKIPLLHAANLEEGGAGAASDGTYFASQLQIAASGDTEDCKNFAKVCADEGRKAGINWTFSPVSDIDVNYLNPITNCRTYGSDTDRVAECAAEYTKIVQAAGIAAAAKHFPGDGVDYRDQHLHPTYNSLSAEEWRESYGKVYRRLIDEGLLSVMVGHICQPALEMEHTPGLKERDCMPATLSRGLLKGLLRKELGFNGLITTDATIMGGFCMAMLREKAIPTAIAAGCDMIVFTTDIREDMDFVMRGLKNGLLTQERLDEAVTYVLALKEKVCGAKGKKYGVDAEETRRACADNSATLVKNSGGILPINKEKVKKIRLSVLGEDKCWDGELHTMLERELVKRGFAVEQYEPFKDDFHAVRDLPDDVLHLVALNYPPRSNFVTERLSWCPKHAMEMPRYLHEMPYIYVSFANPYHLQDIPRTKVYINAYTATSATVEAVVAKLCGESGFTGISPVDAFCGLPDTR